MKFVKSYAAVTTKDSIELLINSTVRVKRRPKKTVNVKPKH